MLIFLINTQKRIENAPQKPNLDILKIRAACHFWMIFSLYMLHTQNNDKPCWYSLSARKNESKTLSNSQIWTYWKFKHQASFGRFSASLCFILKITICHADIRYHQAKMNRKHSLKGKLGHIENSSILLFLDYFQLNYASNSK